MNEYRPWEEQGKSEAEYYKGKYMEARMETEALTARAAANAHSASQRAQRESERGYLWAKWKSRAEKAEAERDALQRRCDRLVSGDEIESDRLTEADDKLVAALAERDELRRKYEQAKAEVTKLQAEYFDKIDCQSTPKRELRCVDE